MCFLEENRIVARDIFVVILEFFCFYFDGGVEIFEFFF